MPDSTYMPDVVGRRNVDARAGWARPLAVLVLKIVLLAAIAGACVWLKPGLPQACYSDMPCLAGP